MKLPHNSKEVSKFLGMSQWYAKFIKNYADICERLYNLKRKLNLFISSIHAHKAFDVVNAAVTKAPVLKFPDFKKPFELFTDASSIGVGAVLNQEQRPVVFASRTLSAAERNYTATERECLAVVWALNKFRTYLGSLPIKVITDHAALTHLTTDNFFDNYISRFGAPIKLISDNGPQFISDSFENLSERLGIRHVKTVVYRPQANRTERVNCDLVQMIANYVNEQHDTWDTAIVTKTWLLYHASRRIETPPRSLDLNPIENLWMHLDTEVRKENVTSKENLKEKLQVVRNSIERHRNHKEIN
ncbi:retrovirus-related Pol polyprotein from transposon 297 [Trichonephila clavipes]|uniref:RNA-directed DNA polymerase n=1 Tax=Trichonephila clavipes TaxID=2585209 RepID=A0A8X6W3H2_TRICX|nr:retrovirus-related Pol polyprotein from transposon 297 [Trichonephila clavipes]